MTNLEGFTHVDAEFTIFNEDGEYIDYELIGRLLDGSDLRATFFYDCDEDAYAGIEYHKSADSESEWVNVNKHDKIPSNFKQHAWQAMDKVKRSLICSN